MCSDRRALIYSLNGQCLIDQEICSTEDDMIYSCAFLAPLRNSWDGQEVVLTGHCKSIVNIWEVVISTEGKWHLSLIRRLHNTDPRTKMEGKASAAITAILTSETKVWTGDENGRAVSLLCHLKIISILTCISLSGAQLGDEKQPCFSRHA